LSDKPLVSIILPVHNAGIYLTKCLETLVGQTLKEIEIICIVDCPDDGSDRVVEDFSKRDNRIKVITNERNLHIAESRNRGLKIARGKYLGFSDHDDWRELDMYEKLITTALKEDADSVISNSFIERESGQEYHVYNDPSSNGIIKSLILSMWCTGNSNFLSKSVWASIYKRDIIEKNKIDFPERSRFYEEDTLFNLKFYLNAKKVFLVNKGFYHWNKFEHYTSENSFMFADRQVNFYFEIKRLLNDENKYDQFSGYLSSLISTYVYAFLDRYTKLPKEKLFMLSCLNNLIKRREIDINFINNKDYQKNIIYFHLFKLKLGYLKLLRSLKR
jgi:glycosyltransferase involved in cell wall biosynthesis